MNRFTIDKNMRFLLALLKLNELCVLQRADLPVDLFERHAITLTSEQYFTLWNAIIDEYSAPLPIPLKLADLPMFTGVSVPIMAALYSQNFVEFVRRIQQYKPLIGPLSIDVNVTDSNVSLDIYHIEQTQTLHPVIVEAELVFFTKLIRHATGRHIVPLSVQSSVAIEHSAYADYFGVQPTIGSTNRLTLSKEDAYLPFLLADSEVWNQFEPELKRRLHQLRPDSSFIEKVTAVVVELLPMGLCSLEMVAAKLCVSTRTVQRKLNCEGASYQTVLDTCRENLAKEYLLNSSTSITEIAFLLGFELPGSFTRAFQTWTGATPEVFRSSQVQ